MALSASPRNRPPRCARTRDSAISCAGWACPGRQPRVRSGTASVNTHGVTGEARIATVTFNRSGLLDLTKPGAYPEPSPRVVARAKQQRTTNVRYLEEALDTASIYESFRLAARLRVKESDKLARFLPVRGMFSFALGVLASSAMASTVSLDKLLARHARARGGAARVEAVHRMRAKLRVQEPKFTVDITYVADRSGRVRVDVYAAGKRV